MFFKTLTKTLLLMFFCKFMAYSKVIFKGKASSDDTCQCDPKALMG